VRKRKKLAKREGQKRRVRLWRSHGIMIEKDEKLRKMKMRIKTNGKAYKHVKKENRDANHKRKILKCIIIKFKL